MTILNFDQLGVPQEVENELVRLSTTYEFQKVSDKGSNGYLFIARNTVIDRRVALKFYYWADGYREHVEPETLAAVTSDAIIDVLDALVVGEEWALFVTPYCENGDLDRYRESNRFGLHDGVRFVEKLLHGVSALHRQSFVHRDLKPENILVADDGGPLIADFGSVRSIPEGQGYVTGSGHSALYRPPESTSTARYDRRGDIYQCGVVLFQVLGGRLSYVGTTYLSESEKKQYAETVDEVVRTNLIDAAIASRASVGNLLDLETLPFFVPSSVKQVIRKATAASPADRYQEASDMLSALHTCCQREVDWRYDGAQPVAVNGMEKLRLVNAGGRNSYRVEHQRGNGWRKVPKSESRTLSKQLKFIRDRCR